MLAAPPLHGRPWSPSLKALYHPLVGKSWQFELDGTMSAALRAVVPKIGHPLRLLEYNG